ncbi:MAG TPA: HYR domain-containing protein [Candidatus Thermoplasmatota archaeon]|nr:HYR domain-containing protein [Candidatus Thermoplasmatota archaeon]
MFRPSILALLAPAIVLLAAVAVLGPSLARAEGSDVETYYGAVEGTGIATLAPSPGSMLAQANPGAPRFVEMDGASSHGAGVPAIGAPFPAPLSGAGEMMPRVQAPAPIASFEGPHNAVDCTVPPDSDGAVGPTYYVGFTNNYNKCATAPGTGNVQFFCKAIVGNCTAVGQVKGAFYISDLYTGVAGGCSSATQHTDPQIVYDSAKDRYLIVDITTSSPYKICVASSLTNDPIWGGWCVASVSSPVSTIPDYEKIGLWTDGLYIGTQDNGVGSSTIHHVVVVNTDDLESCTPTIRTQSVTLASDTSKTNYGCGTSNGHQAPRPATYNVNTGIPAAGEPEFLVMDYCLNNALFVDTLRVNWTNSANTLLTKGSLTVQTTGLAPASVSNSGANKMDTLRLELMPPATYYKDGSGNEYLLAAQTVQGSSATLSAVAWYQLKVVNNAAGGTVANQGIWNPDATNRLDAAGAFDRNGDILLAYTQASSTQAPALAYAGRLATDPANTLGQTETIAYRGLGYSGTCSGTCSRWGDYGSNFIDVDGCTFWFIGEVYRQTGNAWQWTTQIASTAYPSCTPLTYSGSSTASLSFVGSSPGAPTSTQNVVVTNGGTGPLVLQGARIAGANAADFSVTSDGCKGVALAAGASCTLAVRYNASTFNAESATLSIGDNTAAGHVLLTSLSGSVSGLAPPVTTGLATGTSGNNGWLVSAATVTLTCAPPANATCASTWYALDGGPLTSYAGAFAVATDGTHTLLYNSTSSAGGIESAKTLTFKIDATQPSAGATTAACANPGTNGWCKVSFQTIATSASDATSGLASTACTLDGSTVTCGNVTAGQGTHTVNVTATDNAGNVRVASLTVKNDATPPVSCSGSFAGTSGTNGWFRSSGTQTLTASDSSPGSGVASFTYTVDGVTSPYTGPFGIVAEGQHPITCQITDNAGNVGGNTSAGTVKIDTLAPIATETFTCGVAGTNGWCRDASRTVTTSATDATSGIASQACTRDGLAVTCGSVAVSGQGAHSVCDTPTDLAGNLGATTCASIKLDNVAPSVSATGACVVTGAAGWCRDATATVATAASDATSGLAAEACALDGAGVACGTIAVGQGAHTACDTATDDAGNSATACRTLSLDNVAPALVATRAPDANAHGWANAPVTVHYACTDASSGVGALTPDDVHASEGAGQSSAGSCADVAGNVATASLAGIDVDLTAPSVSASFSATPNANGWWTTDVTVSFSCADALSGPDEDPAPVVLGGETAGTSASGTCEDLAGNAATFTSQPVRIDRTPPAILVTGVTPAPNANGWSNAPVTTVGFACEDALSGVAVAPTDVLLSDDGADQVASASCTDAAGNVASAALTDIDVDTTPPRLVSYAVSPPTSNGWWSTPVTVSMTCADDLSGLDAQAEPVTFTDEGREMTGVLSCTDLAGNVFTRPFGGISIDLTAPVIGTPIASPGPNANGWSNAPVTVHFPCTDALSGVAIAPADTILSDDGAGQSASAACTDAAGLTATASSGPVNVDRTPPSLTPHATVIAEATSPSGAFVAYGPASASDATSGIASVECSPASGSVFPTGASQVTCSAVDLAGNVASTGFAVDVRDTTGPILEAHDDVTAEAQAASGAPVAYAAPATHDAVDGDGVALCAPASGAVFPLGDSTVTCEGRDSSGNRAAQTTFLVHVVDTTPPTIGALGDRVAEATSPAGDVVSYATPETHDAVDGDGLASCMPASGGTFPLGSTLVTCTATDAHGNSASRSFRVIVVDSTPPALALPGPITLEAEGPSGAVASYAASALDAVDGAVAPVCAPASGATFALGLTVVSCSASDAHGNAATGVFDVRVVDSTPPTMQGHEDLLAEATGASGATVDYGAPATSDLVDGEGAAACAPAPQSVFPLGETSVSCVATDAAGNAASSGFVVRVVDTTPPAIDAHADVPADPTDASGALVEYEAPATHDLVDGEGIASCAPASGSLFPIGATSVHCDASDAAGNAASASFSVLVGDATPPVLAAHEDVVAEATSAAGADVGYDAPAFHDAVDGDGLATCAPASGSSFALGETIVACSASDAAGNAAESSFLVRVVDATAPSLAIPGGLAAEAASAAGALVAYDASASDVVDGALAPVCAPASGALFALGTTEVACAATDAAGNTARAAFLVTVADTIAPLLAAHEDVALDAASPEGAPLEFDVATSDAVDGAGVAECAPASGSLFALGTTIVTCTASDAAGNAATPTTFTVTVTFRVVAALAADAPHYGALDALTGGVRGAYRLTAGDGTPLAGVHVAVRVIRVLPVLGATEHEEMAGVTGADGAFAFEPGTTYGLPGTYLLLGHVTDAGYAGDADGRYDVGL